MPAEKPPNQWLCTLFTPFGTRCIFNTGWASGIDATMVEVFATGAPLWCWPRRCDIGHFLRPWVVPIDVTEMAGLALELIGDYRVRVAANADQRCGQ